MSDTWVRLVPKNEEYIPNTTSQIKAVDHFWQTISDCDEVEAQVYETLQFFDAITNDCAACQNCGEAIDYDFWMSWLEEDEDVDKGFKFQAKRLICCSKFYTLRNLDYDFEQGFGRFCLEALVTAALTTEQVAKFEQILGCSLRVIYQHL